MDGTGRVLLMHWHDPTSGQTLWEPPGGGIDPGETPFEAARRELTEETGLPGDAVLNRWVPVRREFDWLGTHYVKTERFYLARFGSAPEVDPRAFTPEEDSTYLGFGWFSPRGDGRTSRCPRTSGPPGGRRPDHPAGPQKERCGFFPPPMGEKSTP